MPTPLEIIRIFINENIIRSCATYQMITRYSLKQGILSEAALYHKNEKTNEYEFIYCSNISNSDMQLKFDKYNDLYAFFVSKNNFFNFLPKKEKNLELEEEMKKIVVSYKDRFLYSLIEKGYEIELDIKPHNNVVNLKDAMIEVMILNNECENYKHDYIVIYIKKCQNIFLEESQIYSRIDLNLNHEDYQFIINRSKLMIVLDEIIQQNSDQWLDFLKKEDSKIIKLKNEMNFEMRKFFEKNMKDLTFLDLAYSQHFEFINNCTISEFLIYKDENDNLVASRKYEHRNIIK